MKFGIKWKMIIGFVAVLLIFAGAMGFALHSVSFLQKNVKTTHDHPLTVTRAVIRIEMLLTAMHRSMKDVAMSKGVEERMKYMAIVDEYESEAMDEFAVALDAVLGDRGQQMVKDAERLFLGWRPIRQRVIGLMAERQFDRARLITRTQGDLYVSKMIDALDELVNYAAEKAMGFNEASATMAGRTRSLIVLIFLFGAAVSIAVAFTLSAAVIKKLSVMREGALSFANGKLSHRLKVKGRDELSELADHFNQMADTLNQEMNLRESEIERRTSELTRANQELTTFKENLESKIEERTQELSEKVTKLDKSKKAMLFMVEDLNETTGLLELERSKLDVVNQELEAFAYSVSHDLRAPLRRLSGFSELLVKKYQGQLGEEGQHYLERIIVSSRLMGELIEDLLKLSRLSRQTLRPQQLDLVVMAQAIVDTFELVDGQVPRKWIHPERLVVYGDKNLIQVLLVNVLENAWKFTGKSAHPVVELGSFQEEGRTVFFIKDNGAGFDMTYSDKLFAPFQRLHTSEEFQGTGIGLATVKRIVTRHNGVLWAEGEVNKGATVYFTLNFLSQRSNEERNELT